MRTALVTGGARRIGRAIVQGLARDGYSVAIHCNSSTNDAEEVKAGLVAQGARAEVIPADLTDTHGVADLVGRAAAAVGPLTLLVNNASVFEPDEIGTMDEKTWSRHLAVNLQAPVVLARDFARQLPDGPGGAVVNIIDQRVLSPNPLFFSYTLSKAALFSATQTMAQALAPRIRVNAVGPGPTLPSARQSACDFARQSAAVPLGAGPNPEDIAEAVLFLVKARNVTGQMLAVDGGQHLAWETPDIFAAAE
jgi:NAD(P)-dependent dehydrogenase (short-subunit alcohol dehydrogenase family)